MLGYAFIFVATIAIIRRGAEKLLDTKDAVTLTESDSLND